VIRYLTLSEVLDLYSQIIEQSGGTLGIRDLGGLKSAMAQPRMTFDGQELYLTIVEKAAALGYSLIMNHPFVDGNKRTAHAAMETFLVLNGFETQALVDEQEGVILRLAAGELQRDEFREWLRVHIIQKPS
jgi:death-on-curing protein